MNARKRLLFLVPACIAAVSAMWPADAVAQRRVVRRVPSRTVLVSAGFGYPLYGYPYYYDPFWFGWYGPQFGPYAPYYPRYAYQPGADLRIQVTQRAAEVYIDGYLTGTVDDFDGVFQRLRVPFGEHEISVYREGYRTIAERMLFRPYESYHIKQTMQPLNAGDPPEPRPAPAARAPSQAPARRGAQRPVPNDRNPQRAPDRNADRFGAVAVRVQPADADVLIDGERWETPAGENRLLVELSEGTHQVEIRKAGYKTYSTTVRVRPGETVQLNVSLPSGR